MAQLFNGERLIAFDSNGKVIAGALLYFYQTGTTTLQTVYSDAGATTPLSNPVVADAGGLFPAIYLANTNAYKTVLQTALGATVRTTDPVNSTSGASTTFIPQGRLTLASGSPVMTANQASATSIYYTPYLGNQIPIYDGISAFSALTFPELSNSTTASSVGNAGPAAVANNSNYDLFVWSNAGVAALTRGPAWTSDTGRGTGAATTQLQRVNGVQTNAVAITNGPAANRGTYVGTVRSDGSSQINWVQGAVSANGTAALLGVWNMYNRREMKGIIGDTTATWSYTTATWRAANASNTMRVSYVLGQQEEFVDADYRSAAANATGCLVNVGIGLDSTSSATGVSILVTLGSPGTPYNISAIAADRSLGFHFLQAVEESQASGTTVWSGTHGEAFTQTGMFYRGWF